MKNIIKKSFSLTLILLLLGTNLAPFPVYADENLTPTPPPSDPTLDMVSKLGNPDIATQSANNNLPAPSFEQLGPPSPQFVFTPHMFVLGLSKANFQGKEQIELTVKYSENQNVTVSVEGEGQDAPVQIEEKKNNGDTVFTLQPSANLKPGKYKVKVIDSSTNQVLSEQDFTWGVLAINTDKSIYLPNEKADISLAVLDDKGDMVCTAKVDLDIISPSGITTHLSTQDGSITVNPICRLHQFSLEPDYQTSYQTSGTGRYVMNLTATTDKGSYSTRDRFEVRDSVPFDVERITSTRIYPPNKYPVTLKIHANEAFTGTIIESVPSAFQISQPDDPSVISYTDESPILENLQYEKDYGIPQLHLPFNGSYPVTQGFGEQIDDSQQRDLYKKSGLDGHDGIDFALPSSTPVLAVDDGKVILAQKNWIYGTSVVIQHTWGRSYYGHLSKLEVAEGDTVTKGKEIGLSGSTGLSTGPHLHFGLKPKDSDINNLYFGKIDPSKYLGIASEDPVVTISDHPKSTKALIWNVKVAKGADFTIGYQFISPPKSPDFYTIGPLQFVSSEKLTTKQAKFDASINPFVLGASTSATLQASPSADIATVQEPPPSSNEIMKQSNNERVVFQEIRPWQLAIDVSTTVILTSASSSPWSVPDSWNSNDNKVEVVGAGGNGQNGNVFASYGGSGGGGGAYAYTTNVSLTPGGTASFQIGTGGSGTATWFSSSGTVNAGAGGNGNGGTGGSAGTVGAGTGFSGGTGGIGSGPDLGETGGSGGGGGGGGAAGPGGLGHNGRDGGSMGTNNLTCGGGGGGGNGGGSGTDGGYGTCSTTTANAKGGTGGNGYNGTGGGAQGSTSAGGAATPSSGGGGGGGSGTSTGTFYAGGNGAASTDMASGGIGSGGGGGGGGGNIRTSATGNDGGAGGNPTANSGAGGGGGGACLDSPCNGGAGQTGANGYIVITWTPIAMTLEQVMRHGKWFDNGVKASTFTF